MPLIGNGDIVQITLYQTFCGQRLMNVFHARVDGLAAPVDYNTWASAVANELSLGFNTGHLWHQWAGMVSSDLKFESVRVQRVNPSREIYFQSIVNVNGSATTPVTTPNLALSVTKRTTYAGRRGVGRVQIGGVDPAQMTSGEWAGTYITAAVSAMLWLITPYASTAGACNLVWVLFDKAGIPVYNDIINIVAQTTVRTMHRRTVRLGE